MDQWNASSGLDEHGVYELLDVGGLYRRMTWAIPSARLSCISDLLACKLIARELDGTYSIPLKTAVIVGKSLAAFDGLALRRVRVIKYATAGRVTATYAHFVEQG
ncbi:hypothetical protein [Rathayibacter sp. VKM Ac-2928]|uniref:hypothetical protein n=1 Tax=Rathayibacter sp. VKM Ac-2928 TaxID=2929479 RepID=UPI001FB48D25|nr:hypothetical protein [Rathayibacter sp. VKM Ac-2928]MCJ1682337.1 hypothetical protein [Rathayibacter sp. VKM Ac-2928]